MDINHEYVNVPDALKRIGGSMDLYKRLLNQFTGGDHIDPLEEALSVGAMDEASRLVHTLKGVAANLSLMKVAAISTELDQALKTGVDPSALMSALKQAYEITVGMIAEISG